MNVWIVNPFDSLPCEGGRPLRFWLMAEAFAKAGHAVSYWTADFNHVTKRPRDLAGLDRPSSGGVRVFAAHEPPYFGNIGLRRLWAHWRWARNWRKAAGNDPPPDLVVVSSPPLAICRSVEDFAAEVGAKVVLDVMDAWPETFERVAPRWTLWPLRRMARANYLGADAITTVADSYVELVRSYGFNGEVRRFYHGISGCGTAASRASSASRQADAPAAPRRASVRIRYIGGLGQTYDLTTAVEAVRLLDGLATLEIAGKGEQESALRKCGGGVRFVGYLPERELAAFLSEGDVGLVPMRPESCVGIPYKFADYSRAGLAIVSSLGGESDRLLAKYGAGSAYRAGDPQSLAECVRRLADRLDDAKAASRRMAEREFDADAIYAGYVAFAEGVAALRPEARREK